MDPAGGGEVSGRRIPGWRRYINTLLAAELSRATRYYDAVIQWLPRADDTGLLLDLVEAPEKRRVEAGEEFPDLRGERARRTAVVVNGALNHSLDIQGLLVELKAKLARTSRVMVVLYNPYHRWLYRLANRMGWREGELPESFVTRTDLETLARLSGYAVVRERACLYFPWRLLGVGDVLNRLLAFVPVVKWLSLTYVVVLRPVIPGRPSGLSCVIPARNERGNIENALRRFPELGCPVEIVFVEGHSNDGTWEEIERVAAEWGGRFRIRTMRQTGRGKADAVRMGFAAASEELLTILDADLTMPPEMLGRFYEAYCEGLGDFINGSRLVYPMEGEAMRFLNRLGNIGFAKMLSAVLDVRLGDSLCGTKLVARHDYERMTAWRGDFGDFDPFGDFELLFPAAVLCLGVIDVPVRYRARTYGTTNIRRFRDGLVLLRMTLVGLVRIKLGRGR
jgi:hypothetical protein